jgi:hypothetical protein
MTCSVSFSFLAEVDSSLRALLITRPFPSSYFQLSTFWLRVLLADLILSLFNELSSVANTLLPFPLLFSIPRLCFPFFLLCNSHVVDVCLIWRCFHFIAVVCLAHSDLCIGYSVVLRYNGCRKTKRSFFPRINSSLLKETVHYKI